ncbi:MAG: GIY-YIG nuclease family protein [Saprospiraceae bacterium]|nr:GIY-YIG nuclease family protein [Candidatus Vicinibacter affinis]
MFLQRLFLKSKNRLLEHNSNFSAFTAHKGPWEIVYLEIFMIKSKALNREKSLKNMTTSNY